MSEGQSAGENRGEKRLWESAISRLPDPGSPEEFGAFASFWVDSVEQQNMSPELQRTSYWSFRLMLEMDERFYYIFVPGYRFPAYGFLVNPETEEHEFGVVLYASLAEEERSLLIEHITKDDAVFPVVIRRVEEALHSPTVHPQWGTGGCWATSRMDSNPRGPGVLTAKHVIFHNVGHAPSIGDPIDLSDKSVGSVLDLGPDGVDAALISTSEAAGSTTVSMNQYVAPWTNVAFEGAASRAHTTWVTQVTDTRGIYSPLLPSRVILADSGLGGDSGALVSDVGDASRGVGLYIGELTDLAGRTEGVAQNGFQILATMDMEFYL